MMLMFPIRPCVKLNPRPIRSPDGRTESPVRQGSAADSEHVLMYVQETLSPANLLQSLFSTPVA